LGLVLVLVLVLGAFGVVLGAFGVVVAVGFAIGFAVEVVVAVAVVEVHEML
jgi:hypothetical protein